MKNMTIMTLVLSLSVLACFVSQIPVSLPDGPSHHTKHGFKNLDDTLERRGFGGVLRWLLGLAPKEIPPIPPDEVPPYVPEIVSPDLDLIAHPDPGTIQLTWIGHASFLIQVGGLNLLTDPVFSDRVSPVPFIGPKRKAPPGIPFDDLPRIDAVLISHNHYDHLDKPTIKKLGNAPRYFIPLGLQDWFAALGINRVSQLDWGQTSFIGDILIHCVPAQHFSGRGPFSFDRGLWAGWVIETKQGTIYFAGDSGYASHFKDIGRRFGPIRLALLPMGAYRPRWFMRPMHMDPADAVLAHQDLGSALSVGLHWGTFKQTIEPLGEPPLYLRKAMREAGLRPDEFLVMKFGQTLVLDRR
jgi:N-acyl-phosphatidylethanolamine-hydrolysing phospholipase D